MKKLTAYGENTNQEIEKLLEKYTDRFFKENPEQLIRIRHNIWSVKEDYYSFNIIITSLLVIFDAVLFEDLPKEKDRYFEELLTLNAHHVKSSKLCLVKNSIHLRIIRGLEGFDYEEFAEHVDEFRELYPEIYGYLLEKYYPEEETNE